MPPLCRSVVSHKSLRACPVETRPIRSDLRDKTVPTILIVDDSAVDRLAASTPLTTAGFAVVQVSNGREALEAIATSPPDLVLTDMMMPDVDGLELVQQIKAKYRTLPVVLMTAFGNEETAVAALQAGAASYVPKRNLARALESTVRNVLSLASIKKAELHLLESLMDVELKFVLKNETSSIRPWIVYMQGQLRQMQICDDIDIIRVSTALQESLVNAIEHGNLELDSSLRELKDSTYSELAKHRAGQSPYKDRRVNVQVRLSRDQAEWIIRDEGPGYDPGMLPDPREATNLDKVSGRGLLLIRTFMDEVSFNQTANEIRLIKRRKSGV